MPFCEPQERVFASYAHKDEELVLPLVNYLRAFHVQAFRDKDDIPPGAQWELSLVEAIRSATSVAVFWSKASAESAHVRQEWAEAI